MVRFYADLYSEYNETPFDTLQFIIHAVGVDSALTVLRTFTTRRLYVYQTLKHVSMC